MALDTARLEAGRLDLLPCLTLPAPSPQRRKSRYAAGREGGALGEPLRASRNYGGIDPLGDELEEEEPDREPIIKVKADNLKMQLESPVRKMSRGSLSGDLTQRKKTL